LPSTAIKARPLSGAAAFGATTPINLNRASAAGSGCASADAVRVLPSRRDRSAAATDAPALAVTVCEGAGSERDSSRVNQNTALAATKAQITKDNRRIAIARLSCSPPPQDRVCTR